MRTALPLTPGMTPPHTHPRHAHSLCPAHSRLRPPSGRLFHLAVCPWSTCCLPLHLEGERLKAGPLLLMHSDSPTAWHRRVGTFCQMKDGHFRHGLTSKAERDCHRLCCRSYTPSNITKSKVNKPFYKEPIVIIFILVGRAILVTTT